MVWLFVSVVVTWWQIQFSSRFNCRRLCSNNAHLHPTRCLLPAPGKVAAVALPTEDWGKCTETHSQSHTMLSAAVSLYWLSPCIHWGPDECDLPEISTDPFFLLCISSSWIPSCSVSLSLSLSSGSHLPGHGSHLHDWQLDAYRSWLDPQPPRLWGTPLKHFSTVFSFPFRSAATSLTAPQQITCFPYPLVSFISSNRYRTSGYRHECSTGLRHLQYPPRKSHWRGSF